MRKQHLDPNGVQTGMLVALGRGGMEEQNQGICRWNLAAQRIAGRSMNGSRRSHA